jgi:argininosuccinate lyase
VKRADALGRELADLPLAEFQAISPAITAEAIAGLTVHASVESRASYGGTAPAQVRAQIQRWKERLA